MNRSELIDLAEKISFDNISDASKECYNSRIRTYEKILTKLKKD